MSHLHSCQHCLTAAPFPITLPHFTCNISSIGPRVLSSSGCSCNAWEKYRLFLFCCVKCNGLFIIPHSRFDDGCPCRPAGTKLVKIKPKCLSAGCIINGHARMQEICIKSPRSVDTGKKGNYSKHKEDMCLCNRCAHACFCLCVVQQSMRS